MSCFSVFVDGLFQSTHDRKFLGFQLVRKVLPQISAKQVILYILLLMMMTFFNLIIAELWQPDGLPSVAPLTIGTERDACLEIFHGQHG